MQERAATRYAIEKRSINPLAIVQLPDKNGTLKHCVEGFLSEIGISYEDGLFACWLSGEHKNAERMKALNAKP